MTKIVVASANPVKVQAVINGFTRLFPGEPIDVAPVEVESGVSAQPMSDEETLRGALNRAERARQRAPHADYWIGIEGGAQEIGGELAAFAWVIVRTRETIGRGRSGTFFLPPAVSTLIHQGVELGEADDRVFGRSNSKHGNGAVGLLTGDVIDRVQLYEHALILALIPFKNPTLYFGS